MSKAAFLLAGLAAVAGAAAETSANGRGIQCVPSDARIVAVQGETAAYIKGKRLYGCSGRHTPVPLGSILGEESEQPSADFVDLASVADGYVAVFHEVDDSGRRFMIERVNLQTRSRLSTVATGGGFCAKSACETEGVGPALRIAAGTNGRVLYVTYALAQMRREVWLVEPRGIRKLASGKDIRLAGLSLGQDAATWRQGSLSCIAARRSAFVPECSASARSNRAVAAST